MFVYKPEGGTPIKVWCDESAYHGDAYVKEQTEDVARHPLASRWVCLMPDGHPGFGMPIGGVLATKGGVIPNAVGVDIGCGMIAARTDWEARDLSLTTRGGRRDQLQAIREEIHRRVPTGMNRHEEARALTDALTEAPQQWPEWERKYVVQEEMEAAAHQLGSLGSGNHFIELQKDGDGRLWIMLHSGSRNVGHKVCSYYHGVAKKYMEAFRSPVVADLAFLPDSVPEYARYLREMEWCMAFAEHSRTLMLAETGAAMQAVMSVAPKMDLKIETHHNFAAMENWGGQNLLIHRKGAVKAKGLVTIPGSMGTASFIGRGLENPEAFGSCAHGAGRTMSRRQANETITHDEAVASMEGVVFGVREGDYDEMPAAYKPIDDVMAAQADLVEPVYRLEPIAVVKGTTEKRRKRRGS